MMMYDIGNSCGNHVIIVILDALRMTSGSALPFDVPEDCRNGVRERLVDGTEASNRRIHLGL